MPTCPNGHQSGSDDWCEVCGHRMAGAVPPPPPPAGGGYGFPPPAGGDGPGGPAGAGRRHTAPQPAPEPDLCPQCRTPREGAAPFCEECRWNFLTNTATSYTPAAPSSPQPRFQPPSATYGGGDGYEYQGSRPSRVNRPAEPIPSFHSEPSGPTPFNTERAPSGPPTSSGPSGPSGFGGDRRPSGPPQGYRGGQGPVPVQSQGPGTGGPSGFGGGPGQGQGQGPGGPSGFGGGPGQGQGQGPGGPSGFGGGPGQRQGQGPSGFGGGPGQGSGGPSGPSGFGDGPGQGQGQGPGGPSGFGGGPHQDRGQGGPSGFGGGPGQGQSQGPSGFGGGPRQDQGQGHGGPSGFGRESSRPGGAPQAFQQSGASAPPAFPRETGRPPAGGDDDWLLPPPSSSDPAGPDRGQGAGGYGYPQPGAGQAPAGPGGFPQAPQAPQRPVTWTATIGPDREYFMAMMQRSGPEAAGLNLPAYSPEQQRTLTGDQITIGRRRHSTGDTPDIDLSVPPEDPGVSHQHAVLVQQPDGGWAVVDQNSTNGTTVNMSEEPIQPFVPVPLQDGDRVHVGAWTTITVRRG
ncbi:FHA domain-containing protein [Streptomyces sp. NPDC006193]|uniref:FHA domain-containing protein n=1 Tax=Streptomyces sp. NPDC006193 TaxID=3155717 RepID=UPI0033A907A0